MCAKIYKHKYADISSQFYTITKIYGEDVKAYIVGYKKIQKGSFNVYVDSSYI